jgi:predicted nucleic acid-binding protein
VTSLVLDASIAAKWFLPPGGETLMAESDRVLADCAGGSCRAIVPDLFWPEFGSIQWKAFGRGRISRRAAEEPIGEIGKLGLITASSRRLLSDAFQIAASFQCSVYDGIYVALALASCAPLVTADERLVNGLGSRFPVRWLGAIA